MFFQSSSPMQPYAYGMGNAVPAPMNPAPAATLPPLFPSMMTPQLSPPSPFPNANLTQARYARGGSVEDLSDMGEMLQEYGRHGDTMLAHITPSEAMMLRAMGGSGTINPHTGLPEFFLGGLGKFFKKVIGPVVGSVAGAFLGAPFGPAGAAIGGALGGGIGGSFGHPKQRIGPVAGGIGGFFAGPSLLGGIKGAMGGGGLGGALSGMQGGFGQSLGTLTNGVSGLSGALLGAKGVGAAAPAVAGAAGAAPAGGGLLSALGGGGGLLNTALLGTAVLGTLGRRESVPGGGPGSIAGAIAQAQPQWRPEQYPRRLRPYRDRYRPLPRGYDPERHGEHRFFDQEEEPEERRHGGYIDGITGGQDDGVNARLSDGEFVIPADVVSDTGDGNNRAGARKFDALIRNVRHHKGRQGFPPKARSLESYMRSRNNR